MTFKSTIADCEQGSPSSDGRLRTFGPWAAWVLAGAMLGTGGCGGGSETPTAEGSSSAAPTASALDDADSQGEEGPEVRAGAAADEEAPSRAYALAVRDNLVYSMTDSLTVSKGFGDRSKVCTGGESIDQVGSPTRFGSGAFRHSVKDCGERAELSFKRLDHAQRYKYGWTYYFPSNFTAQASNTKGSPIILQLAGWPAVDGRNLPCKGAGHKMVIDSRDMLRYDLQFQKKPGAFNERPDESECRRYTDLMNMAEARGKWVDFVLDIQYSDSSEGLLKLWAKIEGQAWKKLVDYQGPTWWNTDRGDPYFKVGVYTGEPNQTKHVMNPLELYTDEFRVGNSSASYRDVTPDGTSPNDEGPAPPPPSTPDGLPVDKTIAFKSLANGLLVAASTTQPLMAEGRTIGSEDRYAVIGHGADVVSLRSARTGKLVGVDAQGLVFATLEDDQAATRFQWVRHSDGSFSLKSQANGKFVCAESAGAGALVANRDQAKSWEKFQAQVLE